MTHKSPFAPIAACFGFVFIDQYGVLHDGQRPYPGAIEALATLKAREARVVILSNSGRSAAYNARRLADLGIAEDLYDHFVTSGDVAKRALQDGKIGFTVGPGARCMTVSGSSAHDLVDTLGLVSTDDGEAAELVIISGSQTDQVPLAEYARRIAPAAARRVPCVCTNPDKLMITPNGLVPGAGAIAAIYEDLGGSVTWFGKPFPDIYVAASQLVGSPSPREILCVGDSVEHDIVGARRFGAAAALVRTGVLAGLTERELAEVCAEHGVVPDIVSGSLEALAHLALPSVAAIRRRPQR